MSVPRRDARLAQRTADCTKARALVLDRDEHIVADVLEAAELDLEVKVATGGTVIRWGVIISK
jgi:hypothetical protein|tara:strand:- start:998 stop:1186 length:189 start_codon:yes stop_codon:yes gene_type:complete